jgi:hypothetical protein
MTQVNCEYGCKFKKEGKCTLKLINIIRSAQSYVCSNFKTGEKLVPKLNIGDSLGYRNIEVLKVEITGNCRTFSFQKTIRKECFVEKITVGTKNVNYWFTGYICLDSEGKEIYDSYRKYIWINERDLNL